MNWVAAESVAAVLELLDNPFAERNYERLVSAYAALGMVENEEVVRFLVDGRFGRDGAHDPDACEEQRGDGPEDAGLADAP